MTSLLMGLDPQTLTYLGYSLAALATMGAGWWLSKDGSQSLDLTDKDIQLIARGAMKGALHTAELDNIMSCIHNPTAFIKDVEKAVKTFNNEDMAAAQAGLAELGLSFAVLVKGVKDCDSETTERELEIFNAMLKNFEDPKSLAIRAGKNIIVNGMDVYKEMSAAYTNYRAGDFEGFGRDVGVALALIFIGADSSASNIDPNARKAAMHLVEAELYPTGMNGDNKEAYVNFLDAILTERELAMQVPDDLVAAAPATEEIFYDAEEYLALLNLMSKRN